jgi:hypothetical protein
MNRKFLAMPVLVAALLVGCSQTTPTDAGKVETPPPVSEPGKLEPLVMTAKPADAITVRETLTRKDGDKVVVTGQVPTEKVKPYNTAVAAFIMLSHEDMAKEEVREEFECSDAATCPSCRKLLDKLGVRVELVDASGAPVAASLEGFRGLKPGSTITVEGEIKRDGKDKKLVRLVATKFFPG